LTDYRISIIYCDDGSTDDTTKLLAGLAHKYDNTSLLRLSRNFGKETATSAGMLECDADAVITLDSDGQHPIELLPQFIAAWQTGVPVVVGVRTNNESSNGIKKIGSKIFYKTMARISKMPITPGLTDYRLVDRSVISDFRRMSERNRITRGMIAWLGYPKKEIHFVANARLAGTPTYSIQKLFKLFLDSVVSMSTSPLMFTAYLGMVVLPISLLLGIGLLINLLIGDPWSLHVTGSAYLSVFVLFLVGILLVSQGLIGLYLAHIHSETQNRPLYIVDKETSILKK